MSETHDMESDSREKLEEDINAFFWNCPECSDKVCTWLDRQANITESEYYAFWAKYKHGAEEEIAKLTKACADMVEEMWHALQNSVELPKDADGEYIRLGSYVERDFGKCHVLAVSRESIVVDVSMSDEYEDDEHPLAMYLASSFRRYAPRGKDGKPIRYGDTVYSKDGIEYTVTKVMKTDRTYWVVGQMTDGHKKCLKPMWLTRDKPKTVADVLTDFARDFDDIGGAPDEGELWEKLVSKYADKLQLKED